MLETNLNVRKVVRPELNAIQEVATLCTGVMNTDSENIGDMKEYIIDFVRSLTDNMGYVERYTLLKDVSQRPDGSRTKFYLSFGVEAVMTAIQDRGEDPTVYEEVFAYSRTQVPVDSGFYVTFNRGVDVNGFYYLRSRLSGTFEIVENDGKPCIGIKTSEYAKSFDTREYDKFAVTVYSPDNKYSPDKIVALINICREKGADFRFVCYKSGLYSIADLIATKDGKTFPIGRVYLPKNDNGLFLDKIKNRNIEIDFSEVYESGKKEKVGIFGRFVK